MSLGNSKVNLNNVSGITVNPATEETLQDILAASGGTIYNYIQSDEDATYKYYGYASSTGWRIKRKTLATGVWKVAEGIGDYDTAWADRDNKTYVYI